MTLQLDPVLPFVAAALAQVLAAIVRRLSGHITGSYFARLEQEAVVPTHEEDLDPQVRQRRVAGDVIPDAYRSDAIASVNSKNAEGANALTGSITLLAAVLGSGVIVDSIWYPVSVSISFVLGLAFAVALWIRDPEKYKDRRWLGISRSAVVLAIVNLVLGAIAVFVQ